MINLEEQVRIVTFALIGIILILLALVLFFAAVIKFSRAFCIRNIEYRRYFSVRGAFAGERIDFVEEIINHSYFPLFGVEIETHIPSAIKMEGCKTGDEISRCFVSRFFILPKTKIKRIHPAVCGQRGYYKLETAKLTFSGLEVYLESRAELYIYPDKLEVYLGRACAMLMQESVRSHIPVLLDAFSFDGIREYLPGDTGNMINQKQSARRGKLMVNKREYILGRKILVYVNMQPNVTDKVPLEEWKKLYEYELEMASFLIGSCVEMGCRYSFSTNGSDVEGHAYLRNPFVCGMEYYEEMLQEMSVLNGQYGLSMAALMEMDVQEGLSGTEIFLLTAYVDEALEEKIEALEELQNTISVINVLDWREDV